LLNISQKKELVERLHQQISEAEVVIIVDYKGLNVEKITQLRAEMRKQGIQLEVVKNTLLKRASQDTSAQCLDGFLTGPNAMILSTKDPVAPAKILVDFAKENEKLEIKAGSLNGKLLQADDIRQLATMPSKDELMAKFVRTINEVPTSFVRVLNSIPVSFVNVLNAIKDQKEAA
jgi:large subunit ribosomal protein L10